MCQISSLFPRLHAWVPSFVCLFETSWTVTHQAPLCMGFSRQEDWNEWPFPT